MKHKSSRALFAYWDVQRGDRDAPDRADIDPAAIRTILADTFLLAADFVEESRFRLAGTKVCALFGRELKDASFLELWDTGCRPKVRELLSFVNEEAIGVVAGATGTTERGETLDLEFTLLPLAHRGLSRVRSLGVLAPLETPYWLGDLPLRALELGAMRHVSQEVENVIAPALTPVPPGGRMTRGGLVVYEGGRDTMSSDEPSPAA